MQMPSMDDLRLYDLMNHITIKSDVYRHKKDGNITLLDYYLIMEYFVEVKEWGVSHLLDAWDYARYLQFKE